MIDVLRASAKQFRLHWASLLTGLAIGLAGAVLFNFLTLPLPWIIGPIFTTSLAGLSGVRLWIPNWLRLPSFWIVGAVFGLTITAQIGEQFLHWLPSIALVVICTGAIVAMIALYLIHVAKLDPLTAFFCATPGGLVSMLALAQSYGADVKTFSLIQSMRLIIVIFAIPLAFRIFTDYVPPTSMNLSFISANLDYLALLFLAVVAPTSYVIAKWLRFPAPFILGPLISVAALKLSGQVDTDIPSGVISCALLVIGVSIGAMFFGVHFREVAGKLFHGVMVGVLMLVIGVVFAMIGFLFIDEPFEILVLAFGPGGFAEMSLVAFGLGYDVTFVLAHQLARILVIMAFAPLVVSLVKR
ncbi:MAG: AbrB family transcriptional regulator [Rhodospirillaceae bacterium]|jgi:uncharacterized protein|nr:AbrB family transcriptional regulator [Rhodospirillaceae bacterium]